VPGTIAVACTVKTEPSVWFTYVRLTFCDVEPAIGETLTPVSRTGTTDTVDCGVENGQVEGSVKTRMSPWMEGALEGGSGYPENRSCRRMP
jgi:hypothetical protein